MVKSQPLLHLLGVMAVSLCWGIGAPLTYVILQVLPPAETAFGRCFFAFLGLVPFFLVDAKSIMIQLSNRGRVLLFASGVTLGVHFFLFISGIAYASLSTAVTLVAVEPVLVLLVGVLGFREHVRVQSFFGILLSMVGIVVISVLPHLVSGKLTYSSSRLYGDICAVVAVATYGAYYAFNRAFRPYERTLHLMSSLRRSFSLASIIYFFATLSSALLVLGSHKSGVSAIAFPQFRTFVVLVAVGIIPTTLGHTINQIVSRVAHPVWVSLMSPGETLVALLLGYVFLGQTLRSFDVAGGLFILCGVLLVVWGEAKTRYA